MNIQLGTNRRHETRAILVNTTPLWNSGDISAGIFCVTSVDCSQISYTVRELCSTRDHRDALYAFQFYAKKIYKIENRKIEEVSINFSFRLNELRKFLSIYA